MKTLVQINPVLRRSTSTGRIMQEIGELAQQNGWDSYVAYGRGRDGILPCRSHILPVGNVFSTAWHGAATRLFDLHGLASRRATSRFVGRLEVLQPDVVHIHNIHGYFLNYPTFFDYLRRSGVPVVWTVHDCWLYTGHCYYYTYAGCQRWRTGCHDCPQRRQFPASWVVDRSRSNYTRKQAVFTSLAPGQLTIVPVSDWIREEMSHSFLRDCNFQVIHNGIDTGVFRPRPTAAVRARYGLGDKHVLLGVASIWSKEKGLDDFIQMSRLLRESECIVLVGLRREQLRRLPAGIVGIARTENVEQLAELYAAADAFLNPTWQDNYPTVNLEAISCGTPVVTYRTGGSVEAVTPATGVVVPRGDVRAMLQAARQIGAQGKAACQAACRAYALSHFRKEDRYMDYLHLYERLAAGRKRK